MKLKRDMISSIPFNVWDKVILTFPNKKEKWKIILNRFNQIKIMVYTWNFDYKTYDLSSILNDDTTLIQKLITN